MPTPARLREQNRTRKKYVKMIVRATSCKLKSKKHVHRMRTTNKLLPLGSLRRRSIKQLFQGWVVELVGQGRILTQKLADEVAKRLRKHFELPPVSDGGMEARSLHHYLKRARKRKLAGGSQLKKSAGAMSSVDLLDTMPYEMSGPHELGEDWYRCWGESMLVNLGCCQLKQIWLNNVSPKNHFDYIVILPMSFTGCLNFAVRMILEWVPCHMRCQNNASSVPCLFRLGAGLRRSWTPWTRLLSQRLGFWNLGPKQWEGDVPPYFQIVWQVSKNPQIRHWFLESRLKVSL